MNAIRIKIGTNTDRRNVVVASNLTPKEVLSDNEIDFSTATVHLDGATLSSTQMNQTLEELGATDDSFLIAVVKMNNA